MCEFCSNAYHLSNAKWGEGEYGTPGGTVTWAFAPSPGTGFGFSDYIPDPTYRNIIREAFQAWEDVARGAGGVSRPVNTFLNGTIPAFTNMSVGSLYGTSGALGIWA